MRLFQFGDPIFHPMGKSGGANAEAWDNQPVLMAFEHYSNVLHTPGTHVLPQHAGKIRDLCSHFRKSKGWMETG